MSKVTEFNRSTVRTLLDEIHAALAPIAQKHGLTLERKGKSFYQDRMPVMYQFTVPQQGVSGDAILDSRAREFQKSARAVGLEPSDLHREFQAQGKTYRIVGLNLRAHQYPIVGARVLDGKRFKFNAETVRFGLKAA